MVSVGLYAVFGQSQAVCLIGFGFRPMSAFYAEDNEEWKRTFKPQ